MARPRPSSILLQPCQPLSSPDSPSPSSIAPKRIRFAPLPEPERDELPLHPDDNPATPQIPTHASEACDPDPPPEEIFSSSSSSSSSQLSSSITSNSPIIDKCSPASSLVSSPVVHLSTLPSKQPSNNPVTVPLIINTPPPPSSPPQSLSWVTKPRISLFRPFKRFSTSSSSSSSHTLTPTPSIDHTKKSISKVETLTLGTVKLFRTTSRESSRSARSAAHDNNSSSATAVGWGLGLTRWTSLRGSNTNLPSGSSPLSRTQSTQSYKSKSSSSFPSFSSSSSSSLSSDSKTKSKSKPTPAAAPRTNRHKGTRMLNGRVYGGPKKNPNANPFANARDEEPEFVEWGYGGMGSVKGAKSAGVSSDWDKLQGGSAMGCSDRPRIEIGVGGVGAGIGASDADLDDGSGLAWVKRRREERERKEREQKEKQGKEAEKENSESQTNTPIPTRNPTLESITGVIGVPSTPLPPSAVELPTHTQPTNAIILEEDGESATKPTPTHPQYPSIPSWSPSTDDSTNINQSKPPEEGRASPLHITHENERVLQAIKVPVRSPRLHHRHSSSKGGEREMLVSPSTEGPTVIPQIQAVGSPILAPPNTSGGDSDTTDAFTRALHTSAITPIEFEKPTFLSSSASSSSGSASESEVDDGGFDDDDDDSDEDEQNGTTLGTAAGVEKVSRHKD